MGSDAKRVNYDDTMDTVLLDSSMDITCVMCLNISREVDKSDMV